MKYFIEYDLIAFPLALPKYMIKTFLGTLITGFVLFLILIQTTVFAQSSSSLLEADRYTGEEYTGKLEPQILDHRYAPLYWQSVIGLPDDPHKTVVDFDGGLNYNFDGNLYDWESKQSDFNIRISSSLKGSNEYPPRHQQIYSATVPILITETKSGEVVLQQQAWARAPEHGNIEEWIPRRTDYMWLKMVNKGPGTRTGRLILHVDSNENLEWKGNTLVKRESPKEKVLTLDPAPQQTERRGDSLRIYFSEQQLAPDENFQALVTVHTAEFAQPFNRDKEMVKSYERYHQRAVNLQSTAPTSVEAASGERERSIAYWENEVQLPYDQIRVPDKMVQRLLESSIRNIYQARERKNGDPVFQVGPTHYRGSWAADGPFFMEAFTYLGRWQEVRAALENQVDADTGPGGVEFSKKAGLRLWMIWRHAQLTGDRDWVERMWPKVERDVNLIKKYREMSYEDDSPLNDGLMPEGFGDGGLGGKHYEYTNVYWTLTGLHAAVNMAEEFEKSPESNWRTEYNDYWEAFDKARNRDKLKDAWGNVYVPPTMRGEEPQLPQRGAWAFMHSVFPGKIYEKNDPLMRGLMNMLDATQREGLIYGTGWLGHGIWNYAASFYAHAHLWLGHGDKAASTLYAFGNHASPALVWVEEQYPVGQMRGEQYLGDMPHNWASAEFIRLVRHLMILERGDELHLLEGMPKAWTRPRYQTKLTDVATSFGNMSFTVTMAEDGQSAQIKIDPPTRNVPEKMVLHLDQFEWPVWSVTANGKYLGSAHILELSAGKPVVLQVEFKHLVEERYVYPRE